jgi:hypothetical protein
MDTLLCAVGQVHMAAGAAWAVVHWWMAMLHAAFIFAWNLFWAPVTVSSALIFGTITWVSAPAVPEVQVRRPCSLRMRL